MNKNQKIFGGVVLVIIIVSGFYFVYCQNKKNEKETSKNKKNIKDNRKQFEKFEKEVKEALKKNPNVDASSTIGFLAHERKDLFQNQEIRIIEAKPKKGAEDTLRALSEEDASPDPEAVSDLIEESVESILSNEMIAELDNTVPSSDSDQIISPKENSSKELANDEELQKKIKSKRGEEELYNDIMKLTLSSADGSSRLSKKDTEEFFQNISGYSNLKPTGKVFTPKFESKEYLLGFMYQICKKHKLSSDRDVKFVTILTDNFSQFLGQNPSTIASYWARSMKNEKPESLINNPHAIYIEP